MGHQEDRQEASGVVDSETYRKMREKAERPEKTPIGTIDLTPSWVTVVRIYLEVIQNSADPSKRLVAKDEILRAAKLADLYVKEHKR